LAGIPAIFGDSGPVPVSGMKFHSDPVPVDKEFRGKIEKKCINKTACPGQNNTNFSPIGTK
jgi:hypothetical protein